MPAMMGAISASESPGKARPMLSRARLETPSRGPIARASAPPIADAQSSGNNPKTPKHSAAPQPSSRWTKPIGRRGPEAVPSPASLARHPAPSHSLPRKRFRGRGRVRLGAWWVRVASRSVGTGSHAPRTLLSTSARASGLRQRISTSRTSMAALFAAGTRTMSFAVVIRRACDRSAAPSSWSISRARYG